MSRMTTGNLCRVCGIGFILPSGRCDHCNILENAAARISDGDQEVNMTEAQHAAADIIQHGEWDERYISLRIAKAIRDELATRTRNSVEFSELDGARCEHGIPEGDFCEECRQDYIAARQDPDNGIVENEHDIRHR